MSDKSSIEWTDATWNPVRGCSIVSKGCTNCYAMKQAHRFSGAGKAFEGLTKLTKGGPVWTGLVGIVPSALDAPLRWRTPRRVFVNSMGDLFHEDVPNEFILQVFDVMRQSGNGHAVALGRLVPTHTFQILTKRPKRMLHFMERLIWNEGLRLGGEGRLAGPMLRNVCLGVSAENQEAFDERVEILGRVPAAVRFVSAEPLLGEIDCGNAFDDPPDGSPYGKIHWLIAGGESGPGARPMHPDWARSLRDQCAAAGVPYFFKQWGAWHPEASANYMVGPKQYRYGRVDGLSMLRDGTICLSNNAADPAGAGKIHNRDALVLFNRYCNEEPGVSDPGYQWMQRVGKRAAGRLLDGRTHDEYPA